MELKKFDKKWKLFEKFEKIRLKIRTNRRQKMKKIIKKNEQQPQNINIEKIQVGPQPKIKKNPKF